jgi:hypothetical protein
MMSENLQAQDTIVTVRKKKIPAKVVEINHKDVRYKKFSNLSGPVYSIPKHDLIKIVYANGVTDTFNLKLIRIPEPFQIPENQQTPDPRSIDFFRNFASLNVTDLAMGLFSIGYERISKSGKSSVRIPLSFGMGNLGITKRKYDNTSSLSYVLPAGAYYFSNKIFSTGLELNFYPKGQGTIKYFAGPAFAYGQYHYFLYKAVESSPGTFTIEKRRSHLYNLMLKNGVLFQPSKKHNISLFLGLGFDNFGKEENSASGNDYYYSNSSFRHINFELGINAGYKF